MSERQPWFKPTLSFDGVAIILAIIALAVHDGRRGAVIDQLVKDRDVMVSDMKGISKDVILATQNCSDAHDAVKLLNDRLNSMRPPPPRQ